MPGSGDGARRHDHSAPGLLPGAACGIRVTAGTPQASRSSGSSPPRSRTPACCPPCWPSWPSTRLWVPLPVRRRPFTDGTSVRLPLVGYAETDTDFVPCFTSVQRLTTWADDVEADARGGDGER